MALPGKRALNLAGFFICAGLMAYALYAQHQLMLEPCPLCVLQRVAVIALGVIFLLAALHNPAGASRHSYSLLLLVAATAGTVVAGRHVWLQNLPEDRVPACGPGLDYMMDNFPFRDVLDMVFTGSGECATLDWSFLGLSMPAWVLVWIVGLGLFGIWNNSRRVRAKEVF
ncbi:MAG: disulfide bond formation protein B [Woeseiaceae bacterium]|nr:disulfide bond formation protein B [Woeseiaceae bacterium]